MSKVISIVIPIYNVEKYLPQCLDSIVNQTYKNLEIICVVDGSPDKSIDICKEYAQFDSRIVIIEQENQGLSGARNAGLEKAIGDYIIFVDADDWIDVETCEKAIEKAEEYDTDVVIWSYVKEFEKNSEVKYVIGENPEFFDEEKIGDLHRRLVGLYGAELSHPEDADSLVTAWGKMYKSELIKNIQFVSTKEIGTEDALFNIYAFGNFKRAYYIPAPFNHYRKDNTTSLTKAYKPLLFIQWNHLYDLIENYLKQADLSEDFYTAINNRIALSIIGLGLNVVGSDMSMKEKVKEIKNIISKKRYRNAYKQLTLKYFPIHWKVFFACAKCNFSFGVFVLLFAINKILSSR